MMVVVLVVDSLRGDAPGYTGGPAATPLLDQVAGEGTWFERTVVSGSWTVPSLLSMVTGSYPHRLGICRWRHPFPERRPTLMSAFASAGFEVRTLSFNPRWSMATCPGRGLPGDSQDPEQVLDALRGPRGRDRLVIIHHWWTHLPYLARKLPRDGWLRTCDAILDSLARRPDPLAIKFRGLYHRALAHFSAELLGRYLDAAASGGEDVLLLLTGDHGENWGECLAPGRRVEHIYDLHGRWLADGTACVPLLLWGRGHGGAIPVASGLGGVARGVDIGPTVADLAGIPWPGQLPAPGGPHGVDRGITPDGRGLTIDGVSLAPAVRAGEPAPSSEAMVVSSHNTHQPHTYPAEARQMWRAFGLRTDRAWYVFDGVDGTREVRPHREGGEELETARADADRIWDQLEGEWHRSVGPAGVLPTSLFPRFREGAAEGEFDAEPATVDAPPADDEDPLVERMRMLGYLD
ncbi:MAG: sulfatase-like hydrolase/transferase [Myxococcota bacterium]|jgi:hypothetical protein|nr:sulfatase-like hydrolase/transferase [Myxococcota bacterium]